MFVSKNSDLRPESYPAIRSFPAAIGPPEVQAYRTGKDFLTPYLPELYELLEIVDGSHYQYFLEDLNVGHRLSYTTRDLFLCGRALLNVEAAIGKWVLSDPYAPLIDYGHDFPDAFLKYARDALERYAAISSDLGTEKLIETWDEIAEIYLSETPEETRDYVHGDFRVGNIFQSRSDPERIKLVDWEFAGRGWIHNDLASLLKPADRDTSRAVVAVVAEAQPDWSFEQHWRMYQRCRLERGLLDAALVANQRLEFSESPRISEGHAHRVRSAIAELQDRPDPG